jgi:hypothetical protein
MEFSRGIQEKREESVEVVSDEENRERKRKRMVFEKERERRR